MAGAQTAVSHALAVLAERTRTGEGVFSYVPIAEALEFFTLPLAPWTDRARRPAGRALAVSTISIPRATAGWPWRRSSRSFGPSCKRCSHVQHGTYDEMKAIFLTRTAERVGQLGPRESPAAGGGPHCHGRRSISASWQALAGELLRRPAAGYNLRTAATSTAFAAVDSTARVSNQTSPTTDLPLRTSSRTANHARLDHGLPVDDSRDAPPRGAVALRSRDRHAAARPVDPPLHLWRHDRARQAADRGPAEAGRSATATAWPRSAGIITSTWKPTWRFPAPAPCCTRSTCGCTPTI